MNESPTTKLPRCKATAKSSGQTCRRYVRRGFEVCIMHGAGSAKRERQGQKKRAGRPMVNGKNSNIIKTAPQRLQTYTDQIRNQINVWKENPAELLSMRHEAAIAKTLLEHFQVSNGEVKCRKCQTVLTCNQCGAVHTDSNLPEFMNFLEKETRIIERLNKVEDRETAIGKFLCAVVDEYMALVAQTITKYLPVERLELVVAELREYSQKFSTQIMYVIAKQNSKATRNYLEVEENEKLL
jgi:hypothetical protein